MLFALLYNSIWLNIAIFLALAIRHLYGVVTETDRSTDFFCMNSSNSNKNCAV